MVEVNSTLDIGFEEIKKEDVELKTADKLEFLKEDSGIFENTGSEYWSLYQGEKKLDPLIFSNGKSQEDVVREIVGLIKGGSKIIFLHGTCGTGKSAIALNLARVLGKASIVVPVKALQRQYEEDYMGKMQVYKPLGGKLKIAMITGRDNHQSLFLQGSCADPNLPEIIKLSEKNFDKIRDYYLSNPLIQNKIEPDMNKLRRISIAPTNPYWSPIIPAEIEINQLKDARKKSYKGCDGKEYILYQRKLGCSYYDQYLSYIIADVIIYNSAKYLSEMGIGRKPDTDVEIIDEADDFLDSLFLQDNLNLTRLAGALRNLSVENLEAKETKNKILEFINLEETNKRALGVQEDKLHHITETKLRQILSLFLISPELESEIEIDELNYCNKALEMAKNFRENMNEVYMTFRKDENDLFVNLININLSSKIQDLLSKGKVFVFMSGTLHAESVLKNVFKIKEYLKVEAEVLNLGSLEVNKTGNEFDCSYRNLGDNREKYLNAFNACLEKAELPALIHINAYQDLPNTIEKSQYKLDLMDSDKLLEIQTADKTGRLISLFKSGMSDVLYSTRCSRGVDFPGETCRSIIFSKFPNPNPRDIFWKILKKEHPEYFWEFYKDKANREFLQRIFRALRSKNDKVKILSPDTRVLEATDNLVNSVSQSFK